jgi:hypothetical protein
MAKKLKLLSQTIIIVLLITSLSLILKDNWNLYSSNNYWQRYEGLETLYKSSQYVSKTPSGWIPDEALYAYAGGYYIKGNNPVLVNVEAPPLGKYVIGISTLIFNNENTIIMLGFGILSIVGMIILGKQILQSWTIALIPPLLLSLEPLFRNQFKYVPHFDIAHMAFLIWSFICFNKARSTNKTKWWALTSLILGLFISTKFFMSGAPVVSAMIIVLFLNKQWQHIIKFTLTLPIAIITLLIMYLRVFAFNYTIREYLGIQKYIYLFWQHKFEHPFSIWPLIYLNQWYVWWGDKPVLQESQWRISWPITVTISLITTITTLFKKIPTNKPLEILLSFTATYLAFLSVGQTTARYLVILLPVLYITATYFAQTIYNKISKNIYIPKK